MRSFNPELSDFIQNNVPAEEALAFEFYVRNALLEPSLGAVPEFNGHDFGRSGISPYLGRSAMSLAEVDNLGGVLIDNYEAAVEVQGSLYPAVLNAARDSEEKVLEVLKHSALVVLMPHTSLGSMVPAHRAMLEMLGPDFRHKSFEVHGPLPHSFSIGGDISPYKLAKSLGAVIRTVGVTPSNSIGDDYTKDEKEKIQDWQSDRRKEFKSAMSHILPVPGNIVFVHTSGRRAGVQDDGNRLEFRPLDRISYLTSERVAYLPVGVFDDLPRKGPVHIRFGEVREPNILDKSDILRVMRAACGLSTSPRGDQIRFEGRYDQTRRLVKDGFHHKAKPTE